MPDMKVIKVKLDKILKQNQRYGKLYNAIHQANTVIHHGSLFMRGFLSYAFENNLGRMVIDRGFIRSAYRVIRNGPFNVGRGAGLSDEQSRIFRMMSKYWPIFSRCTKIATYPACRISNILNTYAVNMHTSIINNLCLHFNKHLFRFISYFIFDGTKRGLKKTINYIKQSILDGTDVSFGVEKKFIVNNKIWDTKTITDRIRTIKQLVPKNDPKLSFEGNVKMYTYEYLRSSYFMNRYIQKQYGKPYQFFPMRKSVYSKHVTIDTSALKELWVEGGTGKALNKAGDVNYKKELWENVFNISDRPNNDKIGLKDYQFNYLIVTDGYTVSLTFVKNSDVEKQTKLKEARVIGKRKLDEAKKAMTKDEYSKYKNSRKLIEAKKSDAIKKTKKEYAVKEQKRYNELSVEEKKKEDHTKNIKSNYPYIEKLCEKKKFREEFKEKYDNGKVLICDPGKRSLMYLVNPNHRMNSNNKGNRMNNFGVTIKNGIKYMNYTNNTRNMFVRKNKYRKYMEKWKKGKHRDCDFSIEELERILSNYSSHSCYHYDFLDYCKEKYKYFTLFDRYYNDQFINKLSWYSYLNRNKHTYELFKYIRNEFGKDVNIVMGDWSGKGNVKYESTPNNYLKMMLKDNFRVYHIDEFRTSKYHYKYEVECKKYKVPNDKPKERKEYDLSHRPKVLYDKIYSKFKGLVPNSLKNKLQISTDKFNKNINDSRKIEQKVQDSVKSIKVHGILSFKKVLDSFRYKLDEKTDIPVKVPCKKVVGGKINRDKNAVLNMDKIIRCLIRTGKRPELYDRKKNVSNNNTCLHYR